MATRGLPNYPRKRKYNNQPVRIDGFPFDSKAEGNRYLVLRDRQRNGEIRDLVCAKSALLFPIVINNKLICKYEADFAYIDCASGKLVIEDVKGCPTPEYKLKKKFVEAIYPITITEVRA